MSRTRRILVPVLTLLVLFACSIPAAYAGPRDHSGGFFMRLSLGGGAAATEIKDTLATGFEKFKLSGAAGEGNFAFGAVVANNFAIHGTLWAWIISDPDVEADGASGTFDADVTMSAIGPGFTYYFMPVNMYLSGSFGAAWGSIESTIGNIKVTYETDMGYALDVTLGKEWWVGDKWGLGLAAAFGYHSIPDPDSDGKWSGTDFVLRFSATMN